MNTGGPDFFAIKNVVCGDYVKNFFIFAFNSFGL